jgi:protein-S-isoprenylcysteine O-methyltransferase Ste14
MNLYFLIAIFFMVVYIYLDRFLHKNISEKKSIIYHNILNLLTGISFLVLLIKELKFTIFFYPGLLIFLFGIYILIKARKDIKDNFYITNRLIDKGIYSKIRHPIYLGLIISCFALSLMSSSYLIFIYSVMLLFMLIYLINHEEKELINKFDKKYLRYKKQVHMLIPIRF